MVPSLLRAVAALALSATAAAAECTGPSLMDRLDNSQRAALADAAAAVPFGEGILWSASRDGSRILVAGTMHLHDPRHDATLASLAPAIEEADLVLLEATPEEERAMLRAMTETPERVFITDGPTLPERLDPAAWETIADAARERGLPPFMAAKFRPWFLMLSLSLPPCAMADAAAGRRGLDQLVTRAAEAAGVPVAALEPWDTVFRLIGDEDEAQQIEYLVTMLADPGLVEEMLVATREGYFAGRIAETWELSRIASVLMPGAEDGQGDEDFAEMEEHLLVGRNAGWVPVIEEAAAESPRLVVAAGAAHLPGEDGVLRLLEERGWTIEPLDAETCCEGFWETP